MAGTRTELARGLFAPLGPTYDRYANALSFLQDPRWRRFLVSRLPVDADDVVLDVATGTAAVALELVRQTGCSVVGVDQSPEMLDEARRRLLLAAETKRVRLVETSAQELPFEDGSFDVVMSSIGAMFAPHHQDVADELVRVCSPGGTIGMLNWTPEGMIGALFRAMGPFAPPPPPGAQPPPLWGGEDHVRELFGDRVDFHTLQRDMLDIPQFQHPHDYGEHFKERYGPTIVARRNAASDGREAEFDQVMDDFCDEWNRGTDERAVFEMDYLLAVGVRTA